MEPERSDSSPEQATLVRPATAPAVGGEHGPSSAAGTKGARRASMLMSSTSFKGDIWGMKKTDKNEEADDDAGTLGADKKVKFTIKTGKSLGARPGTRCTSHLSVSFSLSLSIRLFPPFQPVAAP
jgi:hypothetical protein